jgi:ATP-binding cassette subfamily F protein uup
MSYLGDFLFAPNRAGSPVRTLSGGERNRLLLARLFAKPANLLVMDEPTNDLDLESIELLETTLQSYPGTLILVSHDRTFLDNVVTSVLVARGEGRWLELVGGYSEWLAARDAEGEGEGAAATARQRSGGASASAASRPAPVRDAGKAEGGTRSSLSYKEARELAELPARIETLEEEQKRVQEEMSRPEFFKAPADEIRARQAALAKLEATLAQAMARWEELVDRDAAG